MKLEQEEFDETVVTLDTYNSDLNLVIDASKYSAHPLTNEGFAFMWAGVRATHGAAKGKFCFEVKVLKHLDVSHLPADEPNPHVVRVGASVESTSLQLGEEPLSYGYGGTGKISTNCQFKDFGGPFSAGDVILCAVNFDSDQVQIGYAKNGKFLGWAYKINKSELQGKTLFPHILTKNCSFEVNLGQKQQPYFDPPEAVKDYTFIACLPLDQRIGGTRAPKRREDCEMIMMCGLPGAGKSVWAAEYASKHPEKKYNVLGTNNIIDKMKVMGLPRKKNYHGRWDVLIQMATKCLNKMFEIGSKLRRNYILDQTNVYPTAQKRKMRNFDGFKRKAVVVVPTEEEFRRRCDKQERVEGKEIPDHAVLEMKANFKLPEVGDTFDEVVYTELQRDEAEKLVKKYNEEGRMAVGPSKKMFKPNESGGNQGFDTGHSNFASNRGGNFQRGRFEGGRGSQSGFGGNRGGFDNVVKDEYGNRGGFDRGRGGFGGRGGFMGGRGGFEGDRGGFDGNRGGRGGFDGSRGGFDGGRGGRGGFDGNRGGRGDFDGSRGGRGGFDGSRGCRGGFDGSRGGMGGFDGGRGGRGGFDGSRGGRGGFDGGRGGRGGFDGSRGGRDSFDSSRGGRDSFDSSRGGRDNFDGSRGGRDSFDGSRGGRDSFDGSRGGRGGFDGSRGGRGGFDGSRGGRGGFDGRRGGFDGSRGGGGRGGFEGNRGSFGGSRGGFDDSRKGFEDGRSGFDGSRKDFGGGRGGFDGSRGGFEGGRGGFSADGEGFDSNRSGFDGTRRDSDRGGYRGGRGGFEDGRNARGGHDNNNRGGFGSGRGGRGRGGFDSGRGGFDSGRGGFDSSRGGFDSGRGGFDSGRGSRGGFGSQRGSFEGGRGNNRGGFDRKRSYEDGPGNNPGSYDSGNFDDNSSSTFGSVNRGGLRGRGSGSQSSFSGRDYNSGNNQGRYDSGKDSRREPSDLGNQTSSYGGSYSSWNNSNSSNSASNYSSQGNYSDYSGNTVRNYDQGYSSYGDSSDKAQSGFNSSSSISSRNTSRSFTGGSMGTFKKESNLGVVGSNVDNSSKTSRGRPGGRTSRWSAETTQAPTYSQTTTVTTASSPYSSYGSSVQTDPIVSSGQPQYATYSTYTQSNPPTQGYSSTPTYGYQPTTLTSTVAPQHWPTAQAPPPPPPPPPAPAPAPAPVQVSADQTQWAQYYQQTQASQYYSQFYGQPAAATPVAYTPTYGAK